jgi:DNA-binding response OmpR family regulator
MHKILIVEDEQPIANLISMNLTAEGYQCTWASTGKEAADVIEEQNFDLVLLDIMLPEINGYELLEYIKTLDVPVIFVSAKGTVEDKIKGLKLGADDYLTKPFQIEELLARVEAVLRRYGKTVQELQFQHLRIQLDSRIVLCNEDAVYLTNKEFDLLVELIQNKNIALYREQLYQKIWDEDYMGETRTLDAHIQRLRKKLLLEEQIKTVYRIGYRLEGD